MQKENFVDPSRISVIIPYSDLEKMALMAQKMEYMEKQYKRLEEKYTAIQGMFSECLHVVLEIREFVSCTLSRPPKINKFAPAKRAVALLV